VRSHVKLLEPPRDFSYTFAMRHLGLLSILLAGTAVADKATTTMRTVVLDAIPVLSETGMGGKVLP